MFCNKMINKMINSISFQSCDYSDTWSWRHIKTTNIHKLNNKKKAGGACRTIQSFLGATQLLVFAHRTESILKLNLWLDNFMQVYNIFWFLSSTLSLSYLLPGIDNTHLPSRPAPFPIFFRSVSFNQSCLCKHWTGSVRWNLISVIRGHPIFKL